jgi:hypothetical protein
MIYTYTTAKELIDFKIQRNNLFLELIEIENKIIKLDMIIKYRALNYNSERVKMIQTINDIEKNQLKEYSLERESEVNKLIEDISKPCEVESIKKEINELRIEYSKQLLKIEEINSKIPLRGVVTNFKYMEDDTNSNCREILRRT